MSATSLRMRRLACILLIATLTATTTYASPRRAHVLLSRLGNFHVLLPAGFPQAHRSQQQIGSLPVVTYASDSGQSAVVVRFVEYPKSPTEIDRLLMQAQSTSLHSVAARPLASQRLQVDGHPARRVIFALQSANQMLFGRVDYVLAGRRLYEVEYVTSHRANLNLASTRNYFDSFTLLQ